MDRQRNNSTHVIEVSKNKNKFRNWGEEVPEEVFALHVLEATGMWILISKHRRNLGNETINEAHPLDLKKV